MNQCGKRIAINESDDEYANIVVLLIQPLPVYRSKIIQNKNWKCIYGEKDTMVNLVGSS